LRNWIAGLIGQDAVVGNGEIKLMIRSDLSNMLSDRRRISGDF